jgi:hypothetical protein
MYKCGLLLIHFVVIHILSAGCSSLFCILEGFFRLSYLPPSSSKFHKEKIKD